MEVCINKKNNETGCSCPESSCPRHGVCCECIRYHQKGGGKPFCLY